MEMGQILSEAFGTCLILSTCLVTGYIVDDKDSGSQNDSLRRNLEII